MVEPCTGGGMAEYLVPSYGALWDVVRWGYSPAEALYKYLHLDMAKELKLQNPKQPAVGPLFPLGNRPG